MNTIIKSIRIILGQFKGWLLINCVYPFKYASGSVQSLIPKDLVVGKRPVIEQEIYFSNYLKSIGNECFIGCRSVIDNCSRIGSFSSISKDVKIGMNNHPLNLFSTSPRFYLKKYGRVDTDSALHILPTIIEEDVLISSNAVILSGLTIGRGAVIAAGAIVVKDVEPYSIVAGVPAKHIRFRLGEQARNQLIAVDFNNENEIKQAIEYIDSANNSGR